MQIAINQSTSQVGASSVADLEGIEIEELEEMEEEFTHHDSIITRYGERGEMSVNLTALIQN